MANVLAEFSGEFRRSKKIGEVIKEEGVIGQIYDGNIWQNQHSSVGGTIDMLTETGAYVDIGDVISSITVGGILVAAAEPFPAGLESLSSDAAVDDTSPLSASAMLPEKDQAASEDKPETSVKEFAETKTKRFVERLKQRNK